MLWPSGDEKPDPGVVYEGEEFRVVLPAKSAVRMEGRAADEYEHAIPPVSEDRISLTFRRRMAANTEGDAIAAQMAMTEQFRAMYREKRAVGRDDSLKEPKEVSEEQRRRESIAAERAAIKAAREERKKAKQLRKEGKRSDALEMEEATRKNPSPSVKTSVSNAGTTATELVKKPPKRACAVVPENFIDAAEKVTAMPEVEREHVQKVYDIVAQQWHGTRYRAWTGVEAFVRKQPPGLLAADVGCGNGKNIPEIVKGGGFALGSDFSRGLIEICRDSGYEVMVADAVILPYRSDVFDYALNIAVLHHISSPERRVELVKETMRIVKVGGVALFYAWALEQEQGGVSGHQFEGQDVLVPFHNKIKVKGVAPEDERERQSRVSGAPTHGEADREKRSVVYQRYCHVYTEGELPKLFENLPWCEVTAAYYDHGNWCVEVLKTSRP
jgi:alkylated DNA repair protein alkB family protein 8